MFSCNETDSVGGFSFDLPAQQAMIEPTIKKDKQKVLITADNIITGKVSISLLSSSTNVKNYLDRSVFGGISRIICKIRAWIIVIKEVGV